MSQERLDGHPIIPCMHLNKAGKKCEIGRSFPGDCCCAAYDAALPEEERTRCEIWTRVMGYHRPVTSFNPGKQAEHKDRRYFTEPSDASGILDAAALAFVGLVEVGT